MVFFFLTGATERPNPPVAAVRGASLSHSTSCVRSSARFSISPRFSSLFIMRSSSLLVVCALVVCAVLVSAHSRRHHHGNVNAGAKPTVTAPRTHSPNPAQHGEQGKEDGYTTIMGYFETPKRPPRPIYEAQWVRNRAVHVAWLRTVTGNGEATLNCQHCSAGGSALISFVMSFLVSSLSRMWRTSTRTEVTTPR
jgi:hypothetical protein